MQYRVYLNNLAAIRILEREWSFSFSECAIGLYDCGVWHEADLRSMSNTDWWWIRTYVDLWPVSGE